MASHKRGATLKKNRPAQDEAALIWLDLLFVDFRYSIEV